jgi:CTP synthase
MSKISLFCSVAEEAVIEEKDVETSIYEVPLQFERYGLDGFLLRMLSLKKGRSRPHHLERYVARLKEAKGSVTIAVAGKYTRLKDAYKSIWEALVHAAVANRVSANIVYVDVEASDMRQRLAQADGILVPGGFGERGILGKVDAVRCAREARIPFFGICLGMQCAAIEFARNVCGMTDAHSTEFNPRTRHPVIDLMPEQRGVALGGTMRLGSYPCRLSEGTRARRAYRRERVHERHRHRFELNNRYRRALQGRGMVISGEYPAKRLAEIIELPDHPWFVGVQFHPEFKSRPNRPHPLFREFVRAAKLRRASRR